jgi:hypothetical protein
MSKHAVSSGDVAGLWARFSQLKDKVQVRTGQVVPIIVIQEAGLDGFWIHRVNRRHVVTPGVSLFSGTYYADRRRDPSPIHMPRHDSEKAACAF